MADNLLFGAPSPASPAMVFGAGEPLAPGDLRFSAVAPASPNLRFGAEGADTGLPPVDAALVGTLPLPVLLAEGLVATPVALAGTLPGLTLQAFAAMTVEAALTGALPGPTLLAQTRSIARVRLTGTLPLPDVLFEARYFSNTSRPTVGQRATVWHPTHLADQTGLEHRQQVGQKAPVGWQQAWQQGQMLQPGVDHPLPKVLARDHVSGESVFQQAQPLPDLTAFRHQEAARSVRVLLADAFEQAAGLRDATGFRHQVADSTKRGSRQGRWQDAIGLRKSWITDFKTAKPWVLSYRGRHQEAVPPPPGISALPVTKPPKPSLCYEAEPGLVFELPLAENGNLLLRCDYDSADPTPWEQVIVPVKRVYIVLNNTALRRLSDNAVVPCTSMSLSLDVTSWTWGFDASIPGNYQALVEPTSDGPVALAAWINGTEFRVLAESISRERSFGKVGLRVSGRGINAELDAPYAPIQTFRNIEGRTSEQLLDDVLTVNGVPMGYTFDYQPEPWNVPAGAFNFQGTYIGALAAVAQAGGGYLKPHTRDRAFSVQQLYPIAPWEWDTAVPDFVLPSAVVTREGVQWKELPLYNRVFVSGQDNGVLGQVTRAGTDGTLLAPMVVDALITSATAARQRGLSVLGNTGRQLMHSLRLPVLTTTGVIQPGALVQYEDGGDVRVGMVRSTSVEVGYPDVYQTIGVECHA